VPGNDGKVATDGVYSVHNAVIKGDRSYASWYSDGVRVVDLSDPGRPREVAWFVPPPAPPRQTAATAQGGRRDMPLVWGVFPWKGMVLASDMNSGLWVIRVTGDAAGGAGARSGGAGTGSGGPGQAPTSIPEVATEPGPVADGPSGQTIATWVGLTGLALGLLAVGAVVLRSRRGAGPAGPLR
jgi:hypothetical protein